MTSAPAIELRRYTDLAPVRDVMLELWADVRAPLLHLPNYRTDMFAERLDRHATEPGFAAVVGWDEGEPVGYAYCNTADAGDRWWKRMAPPLPEEMTAAPVAVMKEIGVRGPWRGTGTARRIHDALLTGRPEPRSGLTVNPEAGGGKVLRLYESWGYRAVSSQQPSPESPVLTAMLRELPHD